MKYIRLLKNALGFAYEYPFPAVFYSIFFIKKGQLY